MTNLKLDKWIISSTLLLMIIGLVIVASSSIAVADNSYHKPLYFLMRQLIFLVLALSVALTTLFIPIEFYFKKHNIILWACFLLLIAVLIPGIGQSVNGSRRWINLGFMSLQVSEGVKLGMIIFLARELTLIKNIKINEVQNLGKTIILLLLASILLLIEPDFGATCVLCASALGMLFISGVRLRWFILMITFMIAAMSALVIFSPYRFARLTGFLDPWAHKYTAGYQLTQSLIAFGRGGIFGVGLGNSIQKLFYLPEAHTDFVLAIAAEELGLIGILVILSLYAILIFRGLKISNRNLTNNYKFHGYLAYGLTFWLALQMLINVGVNIGLLPTKGLTLPFISYGGSSMLLNAIAVAILIRIDFEYKIYRRAHVPRPIKRSI